MKKSVGFLGVFLIVMFSFSFALAAEAGSGKCDLEVSLLNQDPYPAIPGEEVKVVFQVDGVDNPDCRTITFEFIEEFPFSVKGGQNNQIVIEGGTHSQDFRSFFLAPFELIVDEDALEGEDKASVRINAGSTGGSSFRVYDLNITVEDVRTDFEVSIKDYVKTTQIITFEILNIGESDVEALTVEVPKQEGFDVKGSKRNIVGSLDSNEDTTFDFEGVPENGDLVLKILYTDETGVRRTVEQSVEFDTSYFEGRARDANGSSGVTWVIVVVVLVGGFLWWRARKKKKERHARRHGR